MNDLMISYSDDGGHTWSAEQWYDLGPVGKYLHRVILQRQGSAYQRVYKLATTSERSFTIISAHADIE